MPTQFDGYKSTAKLRGLVFELDRETVGLLCGAPCCYCGGMGGGIDRIDNAKGYESENVAPSCFDCNQMKGSWSAAWFFASCVLIRDRAAASMEIITYLDSWKPQLPRRIADPRKVAKRWSTLKSSAKRSGIEVALSKTQFTALVVQPCLYCGRRDFATVGLDRIDNRVRAYEIGNVVPCCWSCNWMKLHRSVERFFLLTEFVADWMGRAYEPSSLGEIRADDGIKIVTEKTRVAMSAAREVVRIKRSLAEVAKDDAAALAVFRKARGDTSPVPQVVEAEVCPPKLRGPRPWIDSGYDNFDDLDYL